MKRNGFTLIELLVVVAIIGVLAAVGVVAFNGFLNKSKENSAKSQHKTVVKYMQVQFTKCSLGETSLTYRKPEWNGSAWVEVEVNELRANLVRIIMQKNLMIILRQKDLKVL